MTKTWRPPARSLSNAIFDPSGDHADAPLTIPGADERDPGTVGRPGRFYVPTPPAGQAAKPRSVRLHHVDVAVGGARVPFSVAGERDQAGGGGVGVGRRMSRPALVLL